MSINKSTTGDVKRLYVSTLTLTFSYTNMVLSTTRGDNELRRTNKREYTFGRSTCRWYTAKMHRARGANLLYVITFPTDCSTNWMDYLLKPRYSDTAEFHVLEWTWKCRIVAASLVLPFSRDGSVESLFSLVDGLSSSSWKIAVHRLMKRESQSELTSWPKTGSSLVKLRRWWRAVLTFSAATAPQLFRRRRRSTTGVGLQHSAQYLFFNILLFVIFSDSLSGLLAIRNCQLETAYMYRNSS